jgi:molybdate transport system substrate-binding protein
MTSRFVAAAFTGAVLAAPDATSAAELTIWTTRAIATVLAEIGSEFEQATGHRLIVTADLPSGFVRRARAGEPFDLLITGSEPIDEWFRDGRLVATTRTTIARSGIGVEVRAGTHSRISTVSAFTRALLNAKSIAYLKLGSGVHLDGVVGRLGIAKAIEAKPYGQTPTSSRSSSPAARSSLGSSSLRRS